MVFFAHGAQKMLGWFGGAGLKETLRTMQEFLHLPVPMAFLAVTSEFLGGAGLIVGLLSRVAAIGICITMLSAIVMVHGRNGLFMNWFGGPQGLMASSITCWPSPWRSQLLCGAPAQRRWIASYISCNRSNSK